MSTDNTVIRPAAASGLESDGRQFGSLVAPEEEARCWADAFYQTDRDVFIVVGSGRDHYFRELVPRLRPDQTLFILEWKKFHMEALLHSYLQISDTANVIIRFSVSLQATLVEIARILDMYLARRIAFDILPPRRWLFREETKLIETKVSELIRNNLVVSSTIELFALDWPYNYYKNLPRMLNEGTPFSEFAGRFKDVPAVVVSAGPSLDKNIDLLPEALRGAVVIASGSAIETLYKVRDIRPHFLASFDGGPGNYPHFRNLRTDDLRLVFSGDIYPPVVEEFRGRLVPVQLANKPTYDAFAEYGAPPLGEARCGPSVSNFALDVAVRLGCNPVIIIGQDLALAGGKTHAAGNHYREEEVDLSTYFKVKGNCEDFVYTMPAWATMLKYFEGQIRVFVRDGVEIINCTEGGAYIAGTRVATFKDAIDRYMTADAHIEDRIAAIESGHRHNAVDPEKILADLVAGTRELRQETAENLRLVEELLERLNSGAKRSASINRTIGRIKAGEDKLLASALYFHVVRPMLLGRLMYYERHYRRLAEEQPAKVEQWVAEYQRILFDGVIKGLDAFLREIGAREE